MHKDKFSIFKNYNNRLNNELVYLDNAASSLTPDCVVNAISDYYLNYKSNIDRGLYANATYSTSKYNESRIATANFLNSNDDEIVFTSGSTDSSNKLIYMFEKYINDNKTKLEGKNEILISCYSHHSDLVPLQELAKRNNLNLRVVYSTDFLIQNENILSLDIPKYTEYFNSHINNKTLLVSHTLASSVTGDIFDITSIVKCVHRNEAFMFCDLTSSVGHFTVNVKELGIDAGYFSTHKMFGPSGLGVLYIKRELLREFKPINFGGGMVFEVGEQFSTYRSDVRLHEAGTPNIANVIAFNEALNFLNEIGLNQIKKYIDELMNYLLSRIADDEKLKELITVYTNINTNLNSGIVSFAFKGVHAHDVAQILANSDVCVRSGHHCTKLLMDTFSVNALTRVSMHLYNTRQDVEKFIEVLKTVNTVMKK